MNYDGAKLGLKEVNCDGAKLGFKGELVFGSTFSKGGRLTHVSTNGGTVTVSLCLDGGAGSADQAIKSIGGTSQTRIA